jgi:HNH endonuclease/AP2 domain-containing protein
MKPKFEKWLRYYPRLGILRWIKSPVNVTPVGSVAGFTMQHGYRCICFRGRYYLEHRVAWYLKTGKWPKPLDHKDGNRANNKWANLREATNSQNQGNKKKGRNNTSGYKGVCWHKPSRSWCAMIELNGRQKWLGRHDTPELAHAAYIKAARTHFGEFARAA